MDYLLNNDLADVDCENWEEDTPFKDPRELYDFLKTEKPEEELVFSHGDLGDSNIFVKDGKVSGFIDLGRSGRADKWYDIAFCVRSIREDIGEEQYVELFFDLLGIKPDWEKIKYYIYAFNQRYCFSSKRKNSKRYGFTILDNFQFIGGMKVGEPSADGRGSAPPELAEQQARAGSEAAPATPPL